MAPVVAKTVVRRLVLVDRQVEMESRRPLRNKVVEQILSTTRQLEYTTLKGTHSI